MTAEEFYENGGYEYKLAEYDEGGYLGTNDKVAIEMLESYHQSKMREELKKLAKDLQHKHDVFIGSLKDRETMANSEGFRSGLSWAIDSIEYLKTKKG